MSGALAILQPRSLKYSRETNPKKRQVAKTLCFFSSRSTTLWAYAKFHTGIEDKGKLKLLRYIEHMLTDCKTEQFSRILIISPGSAAVSSIFYLSFSAITYLDKAADDFLAHPSKPQAISRNWLLSGTTLQYSGNSILLPCLFNLENGVTSKSICRLAASSLF